MPESFSGRPAHPCDPSDSAREREDTISGRTRLTGSDLILATRAYATDDPRRSWWHVLSTAVLLAGCVAATLWVPSLAVRVVASVLVGLLTLRLFVIYHDHQHHTILSGSRWAGGLMFLFGLWSLSPSTVWRSSHNHHHNHNSKLRGSHIGSFPIMTAEAFRQATRGTRFLYLFQRHPLTILFGYLFIFLYGMCLKPWIHHPRKHWDCGLALVVHAALGAGLVLGFGWDALLLTQTLPSLIACAFGGYLFYVQHNFPGVTFRDNAHWTYEAAALESSSFLRLNPILAWFTANIGYHHIHHLNPKIPFYRLPQAMNAIPELQSPKSTTLGPVDIYRSFRLKVWDADRGTMTGVA
ncbi:MAG: fatty acid desaturase [Verrucomicrobiales bacterium]|nr:fatty acid desaturase [Verrucomicrobiales bacterium]